MELNELIGKLCVAAIKSGVELRAWDAYRLGFALAPELAMDVSVGTTGEIPAKEKAPEPKIPVYEESIPTLVASDNPHIWIKNHATDSKMESDDAPMETPSEQVGDQVSNQPGEKVAPAALDKPKTVKKKPDNNELTPREQQMWDYVQECPGASMDDICAAMGIKYANFYLIRKQLKNKGYIIPDNKPVAKQPAVSDKADKQKISEKYGKNIFNNLSKIQQDKNHDMNQRMEDAYMGEHMNIQPEPVPKRPVSKQARRLYEYMQSHPDSRMPKTCEDLGITNADYYMLKAALKRNGWIESAVENVQTF